MILFIFFLIYWLANFGRVITLDNYFLFDIDLIDTARRRQQLRHLELAGRLPNFINLTLLVLHFFVLLLA